MSSNFLTLTNKILGPFNEVQLTSGTFASASGFQMEAQNYVNQAIFDICTWEDTKWPFLWSTTTLNTVVGQTDYTRIDGFTAVNWDRFKISRGRYVASSLTQVSGIATFTANAAHNAATGDIVLITGATDTNYNINASITVTGSTTFTYSVSTAAGASAGGSPIGYSQTIVQKTLYSMDWDEYIDQNYWDTDQNCDASGYGTPNYVIRKPDNNIYIGTYPADRVYSVYYEGYTLPAAMVNYNDSHLIPTAFEQVVVDKAMHYAYMFRDNVEEAQLAEARYETNVVKMRRILIPQPEYATASD